MSWKYNLGSWERIDFRSLVGYDHMQEDEDFHKWLERIGFYHRFFYTKRKNDCFNFSVYSSFDSERYLIDLSINDDCNFILIDNLPSLLMFLNEYEEIFTNKSEFVQDTNDAWIRKDQIRFLFRKNYKDESKLEGELLDETPISLTEGYLDVDVVLSQEFGIE